MAITSVKQMTTLDSLYTVCADAMANRDVTVLNELLTNKDPNWVFPPADYPDNMTPMHRMVRETVDIITDLESI